MTDLNSRELKVSTIVIVKFSSIKTSEQSYAAFSLLFMQIFILSIFKLHFDILVYGGGIELRRSSSNQQINFILSNKSVN